MNFGILVFPNAEELDFVGPWEMIRPTEQVIRQVLWSMAAQGPRNCLLVSERREAVTCAKGMVVMPHSGEEAAGQVQLIAEYFPAAKIYSSAADLSKAPAYVRRMSAGGPSAEP